MYKEERTRPASDYVWKMRWTVLPHKSAVSGETIPMFTQAYRGTRDVYGPPGEGPVTFYIWLSNIDYLFMKIKGSI